MLKYLVMASQRLQDQVHEDLLVDWSQCEVSFAGNFSGKPLPTEWSKCGEITFQLYVLEEGRRARQVVAVLKYILR